MKTIFFIGPSGSGKGTRIEALRRNTKFDVHHISSGNLLRKNKIDVSSGKLITDEIVLPLVTNEYALIKSGLAIFDGFPRTGSQYDALLRNGISPNGVVYIPITEDEAVSRANNRLTCSNSECQASFSKVFNPPKANGLCDKCGSPLMKRTDEEEKIVREKVRIYNEMTTPLLDRLTDIPRCILLPDTDNSFLINFLDSL